MLKITTKNIEEGMQFSIRNTWRKQVALLLGKDDTEYPSHFKVVESIKDRKGKYICESVPNVTNKSKVKIVVDKMILQYIFGYEVEDCNVGLYFSDYLPIENQKLLISNIKNEKDILPCQFIVKVELEDKIPCFEFVLRSLVNFDIVRIEDQIKNSWKLLKGSDTYMTDVEKMYQDTFVHKEYVLIVCNKFADYLEKEGQIEDAADLRQRALVHDDSKILNKNEFNALTAIINDRSCLRDANSQLSQFKQDAIELHWENNEHHPEYYKNINDMPLRARREFVCDCCARSVQYGTDLMQFMQTRLEERFNFSELIKDEILHDCKIVIGLMQE